MADLIALYKSILRRIIEKLSTDLTNKVLGNYDRTNYFETIHFKFGWIFRGNAEPIANIIL